MQELKKLAKAATPQNFTQAQIALLKEKVWPDGKRRPHIIKTLKGELVGLTEEEYLEFSAKVRARDKSVRRIPTQGLCINDKVIFTIGHMATFPGTVNKIKRDGRLWLDLPGVEVGDSGVISAPGKIDQRYRVTAIGCGTASMRPIL